VMWFNATPEGSEDSRMVHAGRPPLTGTKFGVNCFFNDSCMRLLHAPKLPDDSGSARIVDVRALGQYGKQQACDGPLQTYVLLSEPKLVAMPSFASGQEVQHLLALVTDAPQLHDPFFSKGSVLLRVLDPKETDIVAQVERRLAAVCHFDVQHLWPLRVVDNGTVYGLCNRCVGQRCALVCLSERDEVIFPHLGLHLLLQRGDLLAWPNAWYSQRSSDALDAAERLVEDMRTTRIHVCSKVDGQGAHLCLEASFHDAPIRTQLTCGSKPK